MFHFQLMHSIKSSHTNSSRTFIKIYKNNNIKKIILKCIGEAERFGKERRRAQDNVAKRQIEFLRYSILNGDLQNA